MGAAVAEWLLHLATTSGTGFSRGRIFIPLVMSIQLHDNGGQIFKIFKELAGKLGRPGMESGLFMSRRSSYK